MQRARPLIASTLILTLVTLSPLTASAQQRFDPNATFNMNGNSFGGLTFSGVGGAIAACTNVGGTLSRWTDRSVSGISNLFSSRGTGNAGNTSTPRQDAAGLSNADLTNEEVSVRDNDTQDELARANKREECLDGVAYAVAKSLLQQVTQKTLALVNTGNLGNPYYVRDLPSYMKSITDQQVDRYLRRIPSENPVFGNAIRSIITLQVSGVSDGLLGQTMDTPQGRAYESFQQDFSNGGWDAFLDPNNNPLTAIFTAGDNLGRSIATQQQDVRDQLQRNSGFLDMRRCVEYANDPQTTTASPFDPNTFGQSPTGTGPVTEPECLSYETVTPGSVIAAQINEVTTSPIRQLEQADKINEVFGAFFDQMLNWLYTNGLASLRGKSDGLQFSFGAPGVNSVIGSSGQALDLQYSAAGSGMVSSDFDVSRPQHIRAVLETQYKYLNRAKDAQIVSQQIVPVLGALDYCIPGPNPTWENDLNNNIGTYFGSLVVEGTKPGGAGTGGSIGSAVGAIAGSIVAPGIGTGIGSGIGNLLGSLIGGLFGDGKPHGFDAFNVALYDKVTDAPITIRDTKWHIKGRSLEYISNYLEGSMKEVFDTYTQNFTKDNIVNAFLAVDPGNAAYAKGFAESAYSETAKLINYDRALAEVNGEYTTSIANTEGAIEELKVIQEEVNTIVATAKARYIAQRAAAGNPVDKACIDAAYKIDTTPIVAPARQESGIPTPFQNPSIEAATYFYSHL